MKIIDEIERGVTIELSMVDDRLHFRLTSPHGVSTGFTLSQEATDRLKAELVDYDKLRQHYFELQRQHQVSRKQWREQKVQLNPMYWQLANIKYHTKEERQAAFAEMQSKHMSLEEVEAELKKYSSTHSDN
ncbi:MAG: hypothetical protein IJ640_00655 [Prevotella sp.]|nr:hypothetical protein [Prevotella sp.]